jgi:deazaflavin-dependent oxidoreductase (nitroreductase family)
VPQAILAGRRPTLAVPSMRGGRGGGRTVKPLLRAGMNPRDAAVDVWRMAWQRRAGSRSGGGPGEGAAKKMKVPEMSDWNNKIIGEFRGNEGRVGGPFEGAPMLLLHTVGARTGQERVNPMMYMRVDGGYAVFASKAGAPSNPDWYHNLLAHPKVTAEIGTSTVELIARVAEDGEREPIWAAQKAAYPGFADYERKTTRQIPVVILEPVK